MTTLDNILARMATNDSVSEKTAAAAAPSDTTPASTMQDRMLETVAALTKSASTAAPSVATAALPALDKMAAATASAEVAHMEKISQLAGAAMCDGFMARLAKYDEAVGTKTAGAADLENAYKAGAADYEKRAAAEFQAAHDQTMQEIHKTASEVHLAGQQSARNVITALGQA